MTRINAQHFFHFPQLQLLKVLQWSPCYATHRMGNISSPPPTVYHSSLFCPALWMVTPLGSTAVVLKVWLWLSVAHWAHSDFHWISWASDVWKWKTLCHHCFCCKQEMQLHPWTRPSFKLFGYVSVCMAPTELYCTRWTLGCGWQHSLGDPGGLPIILCLEQVTNVLLHHETTCKDNQQFIDQILTGGWNLHLSPRA